MERLDKVQRMDRFCQRAVDMDIANKALFKERADKRSERVTGGTVGADTNEDNRTMRLFCQLIMQLIGKELGSTPFGMFDEERVWFMRF
jgi:hypothetical protein